MSSLPLRPDRPTAAWRTADFHHVITALGATEDFDHKFTTGYSSQVTLHRSLFTDGSSHGLLLPTTTPSCHVCERFTKSRRHQIELGIQLIGIQLILNRPVRSTWEVGSSPRDPSRRMAIPMQDALHAICC